METYFAFAAILKAERKKERLKTREERSHHGLAEPRLDKTAPGGPHQNSSSATRCHAADRHVPAETEYGFE